MFSIRLKADTYIQFREDSNRFYRFDAPRHNTSMIKYSHAWHILVQQNPL